MSSRRSRNLTDNKTFPCVRYLSSKMSSSSLHHFFFTDIKWKTIHAAPLLLGWLSSLGMIYGIKSTLNTRIMLMRFLSRFADSIHISGTHVAYNGFHPNCQDGNQTTLTHNADFKYSLVCKFDAIIIIIIINSWRNSPLRVRVCQPTIGLTPNCPETKVKSHI